MTNAENLTVKLNENDNVATALREINSGESTQNLQSINKIPKGHKISLRKIKQGEKIIKYDQLIGIARKDILAGEQKWNIQFSLSLSLSLFFFFVSFSHDTP